MKTRDRTKAAARPRPRAIRRRPASANGAAPRVIARPAATPALDELGRRLSTWQRELETICRAPGISSEKPPTAGMRRSAEAVADLARRIGLEHVEILTHDGSHPYVCADWLHAPGRPTLLLYSHHDVQPTGNPALWTTPPFEPAERDGRLYARGAVDDKGGVVAQLAALGCHLGGGGTLPCNVRVLVDGEEEIGSPHLAGFIAAHPGRVAADLTVVLDTPNLAPGRPAVTCSLRGGCTVDVEVACLEAALHSGRGGGAVPDPIQLLCGLIAGLQGRDGRLRIPGLYAQVARLDRGRAEMLRRVPFSMAQFRHNVGLLPGVRLAGEQNLHPYQRLWMRPSLTVTAFEAPHLTQASNQIVPSARARLSLRTAPDIDGRKLGEVLVRQLTTRPPFGARFSARVVRSVAWWRTDGESPSHLAAERALRLGYGVAPVRIGAGGSIGFVGTIARALPGKPCVLMGLEDPECRAHSENESLHLCDWEHAIRSLIHFLHELP